jgi:hypothetical protein
VRNINLPEATVEAPTRVDRDRFGSAYGDCRYVADEPDPAPTADPAPAQGVPPANEASADRS